MKEAKHTITSVGYGKPRSGSVLFNVAEMRMKLRIYPDDILLAEIDEIDSRNKKTCIKNEARIYTLMNVSFSELRDYGRNMIMVNKYTLISLEAVHDCMYDIITLKDLFTGWKGKQVTLSRKYNADFYAHMRLKR